MTVGDNGMRALTSVITEEDTTKGGKGADEVGLDGDGGLRAGDIGRTLNDNTSSHLV